MHNTHLPTQHTHATPQAIAQRSLQASEETLETIDVSDARNRLREDIDALRTSLVQIEARLHEVCLSKCGFFMHLLY